MQIKAVRSPTQRCKSPSSLFSGDLYFAGKLKEKLNKTRTHTWVNMPCACQISSCGKTKGAKFIPQIKTIKIYVIVLGGWRVLLSSPPSKICGYCLVLTITLTLPLVPVAVAMPKAAALVEQLTAAPAVVEEHTGPASVTPADVTVTGTTP